MCTAIAFSSCNHYFGRNLDYEHTFGEKIIITPRNFKFEFIKEKSIEEHYALIGMGIISKSYPLYFDCTNEWGLSFAGLNFPNNAYYRQFEAGKINITPYELPLWILGQCKTVNEAEKMLLHLNLLNQPFSEEFKLSPLHFMFSDKEKSIVYETTKEGNFIYDNPCNVLTNNPPFPMQLHHLNNFMHLSNKEPVNNLCENINFNIYSRGMGALGLPGDLSSSSRFVKACFTLFNSSAEDTEEKSVTQFFHILDSVCQQKGCVCLPDGSFEKTNYTSCCNTDKGIYYYKTYGNSRITKIDMNKENLNFHNLISYELKLRQDISAGN